MIVRRLPLAAAVLAMLAGLTGLTGLTACGTEPSAASGAWATPSPPAPSSIAPPSPSPSPSASPSPSSSSPVVPAGVTAAFAVFDRQTGTFTEQRNTTLRFRSASLVKLLIVLDYLWNRGPGYAVPAADRGRLDLMLRSSDDDAASYFWDLDGKGAIVTRMVSRLGLTDTQPPPPEHSGWGSTAVTAGDLVRVYRYLLDTAPGPVRDLVLGDLRQSTRCGTDGFDQSFGIPSAFGRPWAVKQGWYEFAGAPKNCVNPARATTGGGVLAEVANTPDWYGEVLHTTGVVGTGDRTIVVVLTLYRHGTPFSTATATLTALTRSLRVPGHG